MVSWEPEEKEMNEISDSFRWPANSYMKYKRRWLGLETFEVLGVFLFRASVLRNDIIAGITYLSQLMSETVFV